MAECQQLRRLVVNENLPDCMTCAVTNMHDRDRTRRELPQSSSYWEDAVLCGHPGGVEEQEGGPSAIFSDFRGIV